MTFSLLARDSVTDSLGICSITSSPAHGQRCPHYRKNVGIVTTQGMSNRFHGTACIELLSLGFPPEECLKTTMTQDSNIQCRQIAIIDAQGRQAAFTGDSTKDFKGHLIGDGFIATGNILSSESVLTAMADSFESTKGQLADRLLAGCTAGQKVGGEKNGAFSGFLIVIRPDQMQPWGAHVDIRIDYARDLIPALGEALTAYRSWEKDRLHEKLYTLDGTMPADSLDKVKVII